MKAKISAEELRAEVQQGKSLNQIAKAHGLSRQAVSDRAQRMEIHFSSEVVSCANKSCNRKFTRFKQPHKKFCCRTCMKTAGKKRYEPIAAGMKVCRNCDQTKSHSEFSCHRARKDGLQSECKACNRLRYHRRKESHETQ